MVKIKMNQAALRKLEKEAGQKLEVMHQVASEMAGQPADKVLSELKARLRRVGDLPPAKEIRDLARKIEADRPK